MMKTLFILFALSFLTACATTYKTPEDLMNSPKTIKQIYIAQMNYQKAYRMLADMSRKCLQVAVAGNQYRTEENLDTEKQIGIIRSINHNAIWGEDYFGYYMIKPAPNDKNKTELTSFHQVNHLHSADNSKTLQAWLKGSTSCTPSSP